MSTTAPVKIILGTHMVGDAVREPGIAHYDSKEEVQTLLDSFYNRGYRELDTARNYSPENPGSSETRLGQSRAADRFIIHTKVRSGPPASHEPQKLEESMRHSLEDLQTNSVETMYLHLPDRQTPFEDVLRTMNDAFQQGKFKKLGLSNYTAAEVKSLIDVCEKHGYVKPSVYQGHYNPVVRGGEKDLFPLLREHNISFVAYSPAAGGLLSGNASSSRRWRDDNLMGKVYSGVYGQAPVEVIVRTVQDAAKKHEISGHAAALRWTVFHSALNGKYGDGAIFGASKIEQLHDCLDAIEAGPLPAELAEAIDAIYESLEGSGPSYHM